MKIGIDCRTILNPGAGEQAGVGHYTYYLIKNLLDIDQDNTYVLFFDDRFRNKKEFSAYDNVVIRTFPFYQYKRYLPVTYSQMLVSALLARENLDVFHSPANTLPLPYNGKSVVTIHDLAIYRYPEFFPGKFLNRQTFSTRVLVPRSLQKADRIIAVSKNTKTDIIEEFGVPEEKISVVYEGVISHGRSCPNQADFADIKKRYGISDKYFLFLGTIEPRKNIVSLVKAFRNLKLIYDSPANDYQLVIAGARGWKDQPVYEAIADANASILGIKRRRSGLERRRGFDIRNSSQKKKVGERRSTYERRRQDPIKYVGYVSHADKLALLCNAVCFVFPTLYEGFGLPVLEAMSIGTPVITSNLSSLPEIVTAKSGILIDPTKEAELIDAMQQILIDEGLRESLSINGHERAQDFNWKNCAQKTLEVYQSLKK